MQEARNSINLGRCLVCLHPRDWHHRGPNTKPVLFACLKHSQEFAIPHENPISTTWKLYLFFFPHLMKRRMEFVWGQAGTLLFLLAASLTLAEINVEALIKLHLNWSDVTIKPCTDLFSSWMKWDGWHRGKWCICRHKEIPLSCDLFL